MRTSPVLREHDSVLEPVPEVSEHQRAFQSLAAAQKRTQGWKVPCLQVSVAGHHLFSAQACGDTLQMFAQQRDRRECR